MDSTSREDFTSQVLELTQLVLLRQVVMQWTLKRDMVDKVLKLLEADKTSRYCMHEEEVWECQVSGHVPCGSKGPKVLIAKSGIMPVRSLIGASWR